jgi:hypothetical protein
VFNLLLVCKGLNLIFYIKKWGGGLINFLRGVKNESFIRKA